MNVGSDFELPVAEVLNAQSASDSPFDRLLAGNDVVFVDSGRTALRVALRALRLRPGGCIAVPSYLCDSIIEAIKSEGLTPIFYAVAHNLQVVDSAMAALPGASVQAILVLSYFGFPVAPTVVEAAMRWRVPLILDVSHGFLTAPVWESSDVFPDLLFVASLRKLFPVPDGGAVWAKGLPEVEGLRPAEAPHADLRAKAMEQKSEVLGANPYSSHRPYRGAFLNAEESLDAQTELYGISHKTLGGLKRLNYAELRKRRILNYQVLLAASNEWGDRVSPLFGVLPHEVCPLGFPVLCRSRRERDSLLRFLVDAGVFPPVHWRTEEPVLKEFTESQRIRECIMTIPCDHRYSPGVMSEVSRMISEWSTRNGHRDS